MGVLRVSELASLTWGEVIRRDTARKDWRLGEERERGVDLNRGITASIA